jgi:hypothetical protein
MMHAYGALWGWEGKAGEEDARAREAAHWQAFILIKKNNDKQARGGGRSSQVPT